MEVPQKETPASRKGSLLLHGTGREGAQSPSYPHTSPPPPTHTRGNESWLTLSASQGAAGQGAAGQGSDWLVSTAGYSTHCLLASASPCRDPAPTIKCQTSLSFDDTVTICSLCKEQKIIA